VGAPGGPLPITASRMAHLWDALLHGYRVLGFERAVGGDEVFAQLVLARIVEPTSKLDSARVLEEAGVEAFSYRTVKRRLPEYAQQAWRQRLSASCAGHAGLGPAGSRGVRMRWLPKITNTDEGGQSWLASVVAMAAT
jgi:hypothetical protein